MSITHKFYAGKIFCFFLAFVFFAGCNSRETPKNYIDFGTRAYGIHYGGAKYSASEPESGPTFFFREIVEGKFADVSTSAQKAYACAYLAKIELRRGNVDAAVSLLDTAQAHSNQSLYREEILGDYFYRIGNFSESDKYYNTLIAWIDARISATQSQNFDINSLEFMNAHSYVDSSREEKYFSIYDKHIPETRRRAAYIEYLTQKKHTAACRIKRNK